MSKPWKSSGDLGDALSKWGFGACFHRIEDGEAVLSNECLNREGLPSSRNIGRGIHGIGDFNAT